ncbi:MAG: hypothetical protein E6R07_01495 [Nevskiaceae bacterium]|nr:MAG: hypothetical protein E6R07_01495 [Nevskiaceae bacterium]
MTLLRLLYLVSGFLWRLAVGTPLAALLFVVATNAGLRLGLDLASDLTGGALRYDDAAGRLLGHPELRGLVYEDQHVRVDVDRVRLSLMLPALLLGRVQLRELDADEIRIALKKAPPPPEPSPPFTGLPFALIVDEGRIVRLALQTAPDAQPLDFDRIALSAAWFDDLVSIEQLDVDLRPVGRLGAQGKLRFTPDGLRIEDTTLRGPGEFTLDMDIGYDDRFALQTRWRQLQWPPSGAAQVASPHGEARVAGAWDNYDYALNGLLRLQGIDIDASAQGRGSLAALDIAALKARLLGGSVSASGRVQWQPQIAIDASGDVAGLDPGRAFKDWPGQVNGHFKVATTFPRNQPAVAFDAALRDSRLRGYPFGLQARGRWQGPRLTLDDARLQSGSSSLQARGEALPPFDLSAELHSPDLATAMPALQGHADAQLRLRGTLDTPVLSLHGRAGDLAWRSYALHQLHADIELDAAGSSTLEVAAENLDAGTHVSSLRLKGGGTAAHHELHLDLASDPLNASLGLSGALDLPRRAWSGALDNGQLAPHQLGAWTLQEPAALAVDRDGVTLQPACWSSGDARACFKVRKEKGSGAGFAFRVEKFALAYFKPFLPPGWILSGELNGSGDLLSRSLDTVQVNLTSTAGGITIGDRIVLGFEPSHLKLDGQDHGLVAELAMPLSHGKIEMHAQLAPGDEVATRPLSGEITLDLPDLDWLRLLSPEISSAAGHLHGQLQLAGSAGSPAFTGEVGLADGKVRLATPGIELSPLNLLVQGDSEGLLTMTADAASGGGQLRVGGVLDTAQAKPTLRLEIKGDAFQAANTPQARVWVTPDLQVDVSGRRINVAGTVDVPKAQITPTSFDSGVGPSSDQVIINPQGKAPADSPWQVAANVQVRLGDEVRFEGFGLKAPLSGAVTAIEEPGRPTSGRGAIDLSGGQYKAYGQDLSITTGRLIFDGGPITQPAVEIRAERKPTDDITVGVYVRGTLTAPQFSLYSTPAMPQERQLSWLVLGRSLDDNASSSDRSAVSGAALSLGLTGGDYLAQKIVGKVGIDQVSVGAKPGEDANLAKLTIGKYLSPKLFVSYGIGLFQRGYTFRLQYDVGHGFKLQTETGVESGGDVLYSVER